MGKETDIEGLIKNPDKVQEDILHAMKESGVLDEWENKLEKIDESPTRHKVMSEDSSEKTVFNEQEKDLIKSFIQEYKAEKNIDISSDFVMLIVEKAQRQKMQPNLPQLFVQLGPLIEVLSAMSKKSSDVESIIDRQGPVFDSPAKVKDVLHTLTENLKSELVRLTLETPPENLKRKSPPPPPVKDDLSKQRAHANDKLKTSLIELFKASNPQQLMNGEIAGLLPDLLGGKNYGSMFLTVAEAYFEGSPYGPLIKQYGRKFLESEQGTMLSAGITILLEKIAVSESGQRLIKLTPEFLVANDMQSILEILGKEAQWNWDLLFNSIDNSEYKEHFIESLADFVVQAHNFIQNQALDSRLSQIPLIINGFLISYRIPAFDINAPTKSLIAILNKCIKLFTTYKTDTTPYVHQLRDAVMESMNSYLKNENFIMMSPTLKKTTVSKVIDKEIITPIQEVWEVYRHVVKEPKCSKALMCLLNLEDKKKQNRKTRQAVVTGASLVAGWTLSHASTDAYWSLYTAVMEGRKGVDCREIYPESRDLCKLEKVKVKADHSEL